jgi:hypothetical protein
VQRFCENAFTGLIFPANNAFFHRIVLLPNTQGLCRENRREQLSMKGFTYIRTTWLHTDSKSTHRTEIITQ